MQLLGAIIVLSTIYPFQVGKVADYDKLELAIGGVEAWRVYEVMKHCYMQ